MTTTETHTASPPASPAPANGRVTHWRVIESERIKFYSLRSNPIALAAAVAVVVGFGALAAGVATGGIVPDGPGEREHPDFASMLDHTGIATAGVTLAILILGTLGVLAMSGEYSSGMIRATVGAVPKRLPVLWGKVVILVTVTAIAMTGAVFASFFLSGAVLRGSGMSAQLSDPGVLRALLGNVGYTVGITLLGLALGELLRSTAGGIATLFATILVIPQLITLILPDTIVNAIYGYLPSTAAQALTSTQPDFAFGAQGHELLSPGAGAVVFIAWVVVLMTGAAISLKRRDA